MHTECVGGESSWHIGRKMIVTHGTGVKNVVIGLQVIMTLVIQNQPVENYVINANPKQKVATVIK